MVADLNGNLGLRDENGGNNFGNFDGSPQKYVAQVSRPALVSNAVVFFGELVGGIAQVFARLQDNSVVQVSGAADLRTINWKGDVEGTAYTTGDTASPILGDLVVIDISGSTNEVTINLPPANNSIGRSISFVNLNDKTSQSNGDIVFHPLDALDTVGYETGAGVDAKLDSGEVINAAVIRSLGNNRWILDPAQGGQGFEPV
ncbi:MAG: hypothetical protein O7G84_13685 [Gammaproteobacteria bacterium]|nr:hypothetical protein [Gammaproteobacteria bacterium]